MLTIEVDDAAVEKRLDGMTAKLTAFPQAIGEELTVWQREDMHRRFPNTTQEQDAASTEIWPHSRREMEGRERPASRRSRPLRRRTARPVVAGPRARSTRPILRPALFDQLVERSLAHRVRAESRPRWRE